MTISVQYSHDTPVFHGRIAPEPGTVVGYAALIHSYNLSVYLPRTISLISSHNRHYEKDDWQVFGPRYLPTDTLYKHLVFALRYEGVQLLVLKKLFEKTDPGEIAALIKSVPAGLYARKIWFLYEWLMDQTLPLSDANVKTAYKPLLNNNLQFEIKKGSYASRQRIINNLPGNRDFCPLVFRTKKIERFLKNELADPPEQSLDRFSKDLLQRSASFLLLQDSKASFTIEGESAGSNRAVRWGKALGQAGCRPLTRDELLRLQQIVLGDHRFVNLGFREKGGFVGEHDRTTGMPIPDHISAKAQDLELLMNGLLTTNRQFENAENLNPVIAAAIIAFGFVFIHPFQDGNGRVHRYLIHHVLAKKGFTHQGLVFPVSAAILDQIHEYRKVLESFSHPLLDFIKWSTTADNNVEIKNETIDYYRYFDATRQVEFLCEMVVDTIERIIPEEVQYLQRYDHFKTFIDDHFDMPDSKVALLFRFLEQNKGSLSQRARNNEFAALTDRETKMIEKQYSDLLKYPLQ